MKKENTIRIAHSFIVPGRYAEASVFLSNAVPSPLALGKQNPE